MKSTFKFMMALAAVLSLASCSKSRIEQMKMAERLDIKCNPEVLALVGDSVPVDLAVTYPEGYFHPKATLTVTPVLVFEGGEVAATPYTYQGEKVKDNYKVVPSAGTTVREKFAFKFQKGMEKSYLELRSVINYKGKAIEVPAIKVADGVNVTVLWANTNGVYSYKEDGYQAVLHDKAEGQVMYDKNSANVKKSELRSDSVKELQAALELIASDPRYTITGTQVVAYASPEGGQKFNAKLSDKRAASAEKAWSKVTNGMKADELEVKSMGQDWEGFKEAVQNSNIQDKDLILRVLSMYSDPAVRESEIRNMSAVYKEINKNVFPELRRARFIANVDYKNFTDEELEELSHKAIDVLSEEGLLRVAANSNDAARKADLYKTAVKKFNSQKALFNLGCLALDQNNNAEAAAYFAQVKEQDADLLNVKGVCELRKGNVDAASALFKQSGTSDAKANLGAIALCKGDYATAAACYATTDSHDKAVAYILNNQLDEAAKAITCNCARSSYLRAIIAARKGDAAQVKANLDQVAQKSKPLAEKAAKDVEFANFR